MPGIVGIISKSRPAAELAQEVARMVESMQHEPWLTIGSKSFESVNACIGWVGEEESPADCRPSANSDSKAWCIFWGENFSADNSNATSVLVSGNRHAQYVSLHYATDGVELIEQLNGRFSGVIFDQNKECLILFNDRFASNRIYFYEGSDGFYFASEAKAILRVLPHLRTLDEQGVAEYVSCGCVLQNRTLFKGIQLLPTASSWKFFSDGKLTRSQYFRTEQWERLPILPPEIYAKRLEDVFAEILPSYRGNTGTAMSLTGGLDSRMIMALLRPEPQSLPCFSFSGQYRDCADSLLAAQIAKICNQPHTIITLGNEFFQQFSDLAAKTIFVSDGAMDVSGAAELFLNRIVRKAAKIRLTGNYGSEIVRSKVAFRPQRIHPEPFSTDVIPHLERAARTYSSEAQGRPLSFIAFKQVSWYHYGRLSIEQSQITVRSPYLDNKLVALVYQAPLEFVSSRDLCWRLIYNGNPKLAQIPNDRGVVHGRHEIANRVTRTIHEILAKAEYAYDYGMPDWLARTDRYLSPFRVERLFLGRQKFCHFRSWYRKELSGYIRETLLDPVARARSHINPSAIEKTIEGHIKGIHNRTTEIHKLLSLELIHRTLLKC